MQFRIFCGVYYTIYLINLVGLFLMLDNLSGVVPVQNFQVLNSFAVMPFSLLITTFYKIMDRGQRKR